MHWCWSENCGGVRLLLGVEVEAVIIRDTGNTVSGIEPWLLVNSKPGSAQTCWGNPDNFAEIPRKERPWTYSLLQPLCWGNPDSHAFGYPREKEIGIGIQEIVQRIGVYGLHKGGPEFNLIPGMPWPSAFQDVALTLLGILPVLLCTVIRVKY